MGNNATKMAQDAMGATKKAQMAVGSGLQSMNKCISKETGEREDAAMGVPVTIGLHGPEIVIDGDGMRVSGQGVALASEPIGQDRAYFEFKIARDGDWAVGVAKKAAHAKDGHLGQEAVSWGLRASQLTCLEGDVVGVAFDQGDMPTKLKFYHNGNAQGEHTIEGIRGEVYPAVSVSEHASLLCEFDGENGFIYPPPAGFSGVIACRSLM
ncbi:hypothetical protein T484DRAFT_1945400 [Baffinella frigidus]|nr:hypothetical protein T484DRAFT_1945400 [Cryptophyta sp. CCMP2293]|mmetsp:Transcript_19018/g.45906  ORF Transcript_19018/g.45906 Transcript_19018/m.45906 type:complete len:210 (-) Transcript_19018:91-720(-)